MSECEDTPAHRLMIIAVLYIEIERPVPVDLVLTLNARGSIFDKEELLT